MIRNPNNNLSPLPWYGSLREQMHRRSYSYGNVYPVFAPVSRLLPFQVQLDTPLSYSSTSVLQSEDGDSGYIGEDGKWYTDDGNHGYVNSYDTPGIRHVWFQGCPAPVSGTDHPSVMAAAYDKLDTLIGTFTPVREGVFSGAWRLPEGTANIRVQVRNTQVSEDTGTVYGCISYAGNIGAASVFNFSSPGSLHPPMLTPAEPVDMSGHRFTSGNALLVGTGVTLKPESPDYIYCEMSGSVTLTAVSGMRIRRIVFSAESNGETYDVLTASTGRMDGWEWTGDAGSVTISVDGTSPVRFFSVSVATEYAASSASLSVKGLYDGQTTVLSPEDTSMMTLHDFSEEGGYSVLSYPASSDIGTVLPEGMCWLEMQFAGETYYSEVMTLVEDTAPYMEIEWWDEGDLICDFGRIVYSDGYRNVLYFCADIGKPSYTYEEEGDDRDGWFFPHVQISGKTFRFGVLATEPVCDCMRTIGLSDHIRVRDSLGREYGCSSFGMEVSWETQGDLASVSAEFQTDAIIKSTGKGYLTASGAYVNNNQ